MNRMATVALAVSASLFASCEDGRTRVTDPDTPDAGSEYSDCDYDNGGAVPGLRLLRLAAEVREGAGDCIDHDIDGSPHISESRDCLLADGTVVQAVSTTSGGLYLNSYPAAGSEGVAEDRLGSVLIRPDGICQASPGLCIDNCDETTSEITGGVCLDYCHDVFDAVAVALRDGVGEM